MALLELDKVTITVSSASSIESSIILDILMIALVSPALMVKAVSYTHPTLPTTD